VLVIKFIINFSQEGAAIGQPKSSKNYEVTVSESETVCEGEIEREREREREREKENVFACMRDQLMHVQ